MQFLNSAGLTFLSQLCKDKSRTSYGYIYSLNFFNTYSKWGSPFPSHTLHGDHLTCQDKTNKLKGYFFLLTGLLIVSALVVIKSS